MRNKKTVIDRQGKSKDVEKLIENPVVVKAFPVRLDGKNYKKIYKRR